MPFQMTVHGPCGDVLVHMSLYEFLRRMYRADWTPDEYQFEELRIEIDGAPLLPLAMGHA